MADDPPPRSRAAREAAERALVRIIHHYGARPEFVMLGGLVPELLCFGSEFQHAGTTDVDVQVDLEIAYGAVNAVQLERALQNAEFVPENARIWRWVADGDAVGTVVKFELLADLHDEPARATIKFDQCENLGAVNLRGTGFASRDTEVRNLFARIGGVNYNAQVKVAGREAEPLVEVFFVLVRGVYDQGMHGRRFTGGHGPPDRIGEKHAPVRRAVDRQPADQGSGHRRQSGKLTAKSAVIRALNGLGFTRGRFHMPKLINFTALSSRALR